MSGLSKDDGIITVLLLRLKQQRLPRVYGLYDKVSHGGILNDFDIRFLDTVCSETKKCHALCEHRHEYDELFSRVTHFYHKITTTALENEKQQQLH